MMATPKLMRCVCLQAQFHELMLDEYFDDKKSRLLVDASVGMVTRLKVGPL